VIRLVWEEEQWCGSSLARPSILAQYHKLSALPGAKVSNDVTKESAPRLSYLLQHPGKLLVITNLADSKRMMRKTSYIFSITDHTKRVDWFNHSAWPKLNRH